MCRELQSFNPGHIPSVVSSSRVKEEVLDMASSLPSEPYVQLSLYTAQAISTVHRCNCEWQTK